MTKTDFIIECAMRMLSGHDVEPHIAIVCAELLADALEEKGYLHK